MRRDWRLYIEDILDAISKIRRYTEGMSFEEYAQTPMAIDAVNMNFIVLGEAARNVPKDVEVRYSDVPWAKMRGMRNVAVHEYPTMNLSTVWKTAKKNLPPIEEPIRRILQENPFEETAPAD
jgi:uncharacterized protein with HEPN domain